MFEGYYAEHVVRNRERERTRAQAVNSLMRVEVPEGERMVLSTGWSGWSWRRARAVLGTVGNRRYNFLRCAGVSKPSLLAALKSWYAGTERGPTQRRAEGAEAVTFSIGPSRTPVL